MKRFTMSLTSIGIILIAIASIGCGNVALAASGDAFTSWGAHAEVN